MKRTRVQRIASLVGAIENCQRSGNAEWEARHGESLDLIMRYEMPSGSGIDSGTTIDLFRSRAERLVLCCGFHHMDEHGSYDGWTEHDIIVTPSLASGFRVRVTGRNRNDIKDYLAEVYQIALSEEVADPVAS